MTALSFEAKRYAFRQSKDGIIVSFVVHPNDLTPELASAPLGTRYVVALAEIGDDEQPKAEPDVEARRTLVREFNTAPSERIVRYTDGVLLEPTPKAKSDGEKAVTRAVMLCKDPEFQAWGGRDRWTNDEAGARAMILQMCGIQSRSELKDNVDARMKLYRLITRFESETGRMAEKR